MNLRKRASVGVTIVLFSIVAGTIIAGAVGVLVSRRLLRRRKVS